MDIYLAETLNQLVGRSEALDIGLHFVQSAYLLKGLFAATILVMLYYAQVPDPEGRRNDVYTTLILLFIALFIARFMQMALPPVSRPLHAEGMDLTRLSLLKPDVLKNDSSFPSDHAMMFMTIAASVWFYARGVASILFLHAIVIICLPRLILGFHWFSDIAAGTVIGVAVAVLLHRRMVDWIGRSPLSVWREKYPALFHGFLFIVLAETANMYSGARTLISGLADVARSLS
ncbi:MAG: phosphatase PAP2 family protein [Sulfitobacter sp.]|nr:phosphatase PAP2 family protein [Sulfitobacter sp.]